MNTAFVSAFCPISFSSSFCSQPFQVISSRYAQRQNRCTLVVKAALDSTIPTKSPELLKSIAFQTWLSDNGMYLSPTATWGEAKHPLLVAEETFEDGEKSGRGLVASKGILQGECVFQVPYGLLLTKEVALRQIPVLEEDIDEYLALALLLISERAKGAGSFWAPYLDILPTEEELIPLFRWTDEDLALLEGSPIIAAVQSLRLKLREEYVSIAERYLAKHRDIFSKDVFSYESWEWAFAILFSRSIMLTAEQVIALVPYADLMNHNPFCSNYIDVHREMITNDRFVRLYTDRPYSLTDQVFVTYGPKPNSELLLLYGFVTDRNPYDCVDLVISLEGDDELADRKREYLRDSDVPESTDFPLYRDRYPMELVEFLRFCVADEAEFESADFGDFVSEKNETFVARAIISACREALKKYPQSREEDDKLMENFAMFKLLELKQRWAIRQRRAEKRILERTIKNIEQEMMEPKFMFSESKEFTG